MTIRQKHRVYAGLALTCLALFVAGLVYGYSGRHDPICKDGKPPVQQFDDPMGQVEYICQNDQTVTN